MATSYVVSPHRLQSVCIASKAEKHRHCACAFVQPINNEPPYRTSPLKPAVAAVRNFSPSQLSDPLWALQGERKPSEDQYRKELYQCVLPPQGSTLRVSPEFLVGAGNAGKIDFQIAGEMWTIELTHEVDRLQEHCDRFRGRYHHMVESGGLNIIPYGTLRRHSPREIIPVSLFQFVSQPQNMR
jgi:hypothetical protein